MSAEARIMDVNANRAREALRVLEDVARFSLIDEGLAKLCKDARHDLQTVLSTLPAGWLVCNRDAEHDAGRELTGTNEQTRAGLHGVAAAAAKRLQESLRTLEECMKVVDPRAAETVKALRYRAYDIEGEFTLRMGSTRRRQWRLCVLLTESLCVRPWREVLQGAVRGGADCIQVREKTMDAWQLTERVREVQRMCVGTRGADSGRTTVSVIVNDRVDIALAAGADGVHLGMDDLSIRDARALAGTALIIGASTHSLAEAAAAVEAGADYCGVGCMYASATRAGIAVQGAAYLRAFVAAHPGVPHLAIGGITAANAAEIRAAGAQGIAVCGAVCGAQDPERATSELAQIMAAARAEGAHMPGVTR